MIVQKFGGSSLANAENIRKVANIVKHTHRKRIIVLSAMSGLTDELYYFVDAYKNNNIAEASRVYNFVKYKLLRTAQGLIKSKSILFETDTFIKNKFEEVEKEIQDLDYSQIEYPIVALGEICTSFIFHEYLNHLGLSNKYLYANEFVIKNDKGEPKIKLGREILLRILSQIDEDVFVTQGFVCSDTKGKLSNLGRGGSDYSASAIGAMIEAEEIQIWSDKNGILNNDPRLVDYTKSLKQISYVEAEELAYFGAKILHPKTIKPARNKNIKIIVKNTFNPKFEGTTIQKNVNKDGIRAIASKDKVSIVRIKSAEMLNAYGFLSRIFKIFEKYSTVVDVVSTSEVSVSVTVDNIKNINLIINELKDIGDIEVEHNQTVLCIIGDFSFDKSGVVLEIFRALDKIPIKMISQGSSNQNITLVFSSKYRTNAHQILNEKILNVDYQCVN